MDPGCLRGRTVRLTRATHVRQTDRIGSTMTLTSLSLGTNGPWVGNALQRHLAELAERVGDASGVATFRIGAGLVCRVNEADKQQMETVSIP
jgi:hypothetical protein